MTIRNQQQQISLLHQHWQHTWHTIGVAPHQPLLANLFAAIVRAYTQPNRHYHNLQHLCHMVQCLQDYRYLLESEAVVMLAVFYHDIVYQTHRKDNEQRSAQLAHQQITQLGCSADLATEVAQLIAATHRHEALHSRNNDYFFLDADLAILGSPPDEYQQYAHQIRLEYANVPIWLYKYGRAKVLRHFLERSRIYYTPQMHQTLDANARRNLAAELLSYA